MQCSQCQHENRQGRRFCAECGTPLAQPCPTCEFINEPGEKFCGGCGIPLTGVTSAPAPSQPAPQSDSQATQPIQVESPPPESPRSPDAERRQLTVMFCDLVGSTSLSGELDPEDLRDVVRAYQAACTEVIGRFEGYVAQLLGDGLLVYFGYPQAHEDDAQRAGRSGLGMLEAMRALNLRLEREWGVRLAMRVGIHTGLVVVGDMGGEGRQEQLALGETPNVAARLQGIAEPDTVVMSADTYRLVQGYFECESLGGYELRGVLQPIAVYRVLGDRGIQSRLDVASMIGLTPLVGRHSESRLLFERWAQAKDGQGQVVLLSGEAGIGKSRLVQALKDHVAEGIHTRLECRSSPYFTNSALYPIIDMLQRVLQWQQVTTPEERLAKLEHEMNQYRLPLEEMVPLFAALLSLPMPADRYIPLNLSPQRQRQKTLESIVSIIQASAEQRPVLFIMEDAHWYDASTNELLDLLIDQTPAASLLILITYRPEFQPTWGNPSYLTQLTLNRLSRDDVEQMIEGVTGGKSLPPEVIQQIVEKTDAVPLYVEECTKAVLESGSLKEMDGHYELTGASVSLVIPATLQDSLMARLDSLVTAKGVAQYASVMGRQFSYELIQAVSQLDEPTLQRELGKLVEAELVYQRGLPPQATYLFKHALIVDVSYQSLLRSTRQQYHQRIAQVLEMQFPETAETQPELLAHHSVQGEVWDKALDYLCQAGDKALARGAVEESLASYEQALAVLPQLPTTPESLERAIDVRLRFQQPLFQFGQFPRFLQLLEEAEHLARQLNDQSRLGHIVVRMCACAMMQAHYTQGISAAQQALAIAETVDSPELRVMATHNLGLIRFRTGDYRDAVTLFVNNIEGADAELAQRLNAIYGSYYFMGCNFLASSHSMLGNFAHAFSYTDHALKSAERLESPQTQVQALLMRAVLLNHQGEFVRAIPLWEQAVHGCERHGLRLVLPIASMYWGQALVWTGRRAEGLVALERAVMLQEARETQYWGTLGYIMWAEGLLLAGHLEEATWAANRGLDLARVNGERANEAWALQLFGAIRAAEKPPGFHAAVRFYQQAETLADELGMCPLQAHCHRGLGILYSQIRQAEQARAELSIAIEMYRDMEMKFWMPEAQAALADMK